MIKNKLWFAERILNDVFAVRSREEKIDTREVIIVMDSICTAMCKEGLLEFWKLGETAGVDEHWMTTFEWNSVQDTIGQPSSVVIPATYASLPQVQGISRVYFRNNQSNKKKYFDPIIIMQARDVESYRNTMGGDLEGRLGVYPKNGILYFTQSGIAAKYGSDLGMQLFVRDATAIADDSLYPIDPAMEAEFIMRCVNWFKTRRGTPVDTLKDNNDKP
jgi:hypothetical protein